MGRPLGHGVYGLINNHLPTSTLPQSFSPLHAVAVLRANPAGLFYSFQELCDSPFREVVVENKLCSSNDGE